MAGQIETKISLQMQADTKQAQVDLLKVSDAFKELTKQVTQINVNLVGLTPATQEFLKNLQGVALSAGASKDSLTKLSAIDVQSAFVKGTQSSIDLDKQLVVLSKDATGVYSSLSTIGTQSVTTSKSLDQFTSGISGVSTEVAVMKQGFGALIVMQQEQTKALQDLSKAMQTYQLSGAKTNTETKGWFTTLGDYGRNVFWVIAGLKTLGDTWGWLTGKETAEQKSLKDHTKALKENTVALGGQVESAAALKLAHEPLEDSLRRTGFQSTALRIGLLGLSETTIAGAAVMARMAASMSGIGLAFTAASLAVTAYKLGWDGTIKAIEQKIDTFDKVAFKLGDAIESGLSKSSKVFRETAQGIGKSLDDAAGKIDQFKENARSSESAIHAVYDSFAGLPTAFSSVGSSIKKVFVDMAEGIKTQFEKVVTFWDDTATAWPTLLRPLTDAEKKFLAEHIKL